MGADEVVSFTGTAGWSQWPEKVADAAAKAIPLMVATCGNQVRGRLAKTRVCGALSKMSAGADDEPQAMSHQGTPNLQATAITGEAVVEGVRRLLANTEYLPVWFFRRAG